MNNPISSYVVQSLDLVALAANRTLAMQVGRAISELVADPRYQTLVTVMQSEQRRRGVELAEYVGTPKAAELAAEIKAALTFNTVAQTIAGEYELLAEQERAGGEEPADTIEGLGDQAMG